VEETGVFVTVIEEVGVLVGIEVGVRVGGFVGVKVPVLVGDGVGVDTQMNFVRYAS